MQHLLKWCCCSRDNTLTLSGFCCSDHCTMEDPWILQSLQRENRPDGICTGNSISTTSTEIRNSHKILFRTWTMLFFLKYFGLFLSSKSLHFMCNEFRGTYCKHNMKYYSSTLTCNLISHLHLHLNHTYTHLHVYMDPSDGGLDQFFPLEGGHGFLVNTTLFVACGGLVKSRSLQTLNDWLSIWTYQNCLVES